MKNTIFLLIIFCAQYGFTQEYKTLPCSDGDNKKIIFSSDLSTNYISLKIIEITNVNENVLCETEITPIEQAFSVHQASFFPDNIRFTLNSYDAATGFALMYYDDPGSAYHNVQFKIDMSKIGDCIECREPITILHADATEFSDDDWDFNYKELQDENVNTIGPALTLSDIAADPSKGNHFAYGMKGIWRPKRTSAYLVDRKQSGANGLGLALDKDGEYKEFYWFDWTKPIDYNERYNWRWVNEVTKYNVNGASKEGKNRLNIHAASLFGYENHLVTASASNAKTTDIAFDGFEDYNNSAPLYSGVGHGNLNFSKYEFYPEGHTGDRSLNIGSCNGLISPPVDYCSSTYTMNSYFFNPKPNTQYYVSAWTKYIGSKNNPNSKIIVNVNGTSSSFKVEKSFGPIDEWYKIDGYFETPASVTNFKLTLSTGSADGYAVLFDDIRIQPFNSGMETYVYDKSNYRLLATLSNQNYATFYNYDEEGNLTQTKVETDRGIKTISSNRNNIKK